VGGALSAAKTGVIAGGVGGAAFGALGGLRARGRSSAEAPAQCHSFLPGTKVLLADGSAKPISLLQVGDRVANSQPGRPGLEAHPVDRVIVTETDHDFVDLKIKPNRIRRAAGRAAAGLALAAGVVAGGAMPVSAAPSTLTTTYHHPFYDVSRGDFVEAVDLRVGDRLQTADGGEATVSEVTPYHSTEVTYDLTINQLHTYYVLTDGTPILVHNCDPYVWKAGRPGVDDTPQGQLPAHAGIKPGEPLAEGGHHYVVKTDGSLRAMHDDTMWALESSAGHTSLSGGEPVHMAGTFEVDASGSITSFDNFSGHYQPSEMPGYRPLEGIARDAFAAHGLPAPQAGAWSPYSFER
jgi:hypothetical protein